MAEKDGATPTVPVAPVATPPSTETVSLSKEAHEQLVRDAARAPEAQSRADRYEGLLKKNGLLGGSGHFKPAAPVTPPTSEERAAQGAEEDRKAERGLLGLALDPAYREVLDKDTTLRDMLTKNPLAILPVLAPDALDADDAVALVRQALDKRKVPPVAAFPATPPATPPVTPPVGAVNPQDAAVNEGVEAAKKISDPQRAVAGMLKARLGGMVKK